ncbi:hypothetical protein D3C78_1490190 [compost metagenome]
MVHKKLQRHHLQEHDEQKHSFLLRLQTENHSNHPYEKALTFHKLLVDIEWHLHHRNTYYQRASVGWVLSLIRFLLYPASG